MVASGRSQLLIPGFRHAHTLQQLKINSDDVYSSSLFTCFVSLFVLVDFGVYVLL